MVDFRDPTVLRLDNSAAYYAFSVSLYKLKNPAGKSLIVAYVKLYHALGGLYMWVCTAGHLARSVSRNSDSCSFIPDGNSSLLLTMSGVSYKDIDPTDGRYGSVVTALWGIASSRPASEPTNVLIRLVDIFLYTPLHARGRNHRHCRPQQNGPNELSGVPCTLCLPSYIHKLNRL
jgi:hypothetical protein